jgi:hypothetical protein
MTRLNAMAQLLAVSVIISTGSPAFATQVVHHEKPAASHHRTFGARVAAPRPTGGNTTHDDWPANMILG